MTPRRGLWGFRREGGADADVEAEVRTEVGSCAGHDDGDAAPRRDERPEPRTAAAVAAAGEEEEGPVIRRFGARVSASNGVLVGPCHADEGVGGVSMMMERRRELEVGEVVGPRNCEGEDGE